MEPPIGSPITCSPLMFQTTAERRCELTRVRPSGLNATSLPGLVSTVSGEPYGVPVFVSQTKTGPSNEAAASSRPSGLRSSAPAGLLPTDSGGPTRRPVPTLTMDTEPESSLAISVRPRSAKIAASTAALSDLEWLSDAPPVATSQIPTVPGVPGTAIRLESGLNAIDCAPPPGGLVMIGRPIT